MPIPTPKPNEAEGSFMSRCIRFVTNEGTPQEQAVAICSSQYRKEKLKVMTWKTIDRKRASYIKYAKTEFSRALKTQANEYLDQVKQSGLSAEYTISRAPIENAMFNVYSRVMTQFARDTFSDLSKRTNKTEVNWDEWVARWFDDNVIDLTDLMTGTTERSVREIAQRAIIEGLSIREFQNELMSSYSVSERRAELIGRTEIIRASNAGSLMGAQETGFPMQKFWLATRDNRTRGLNPEDLFDHYSMDEDKGIPLDQAFNVSGEQLQYPGDRAGSPGNTINCRCTMTYQVLEEGVEDFNITEQEIQTNDIKEIEKLIQNINPNIQTKIPRTANPEILKAQYIGMKWVNDQIGGFKSTVRYTYTNKSKSARGGSLGHFDPNARDATGNMSPGGEFIGQDIKMISYTEVDKYNQVLEYSARNGHFAKGTNIESVMVHELGHYIDSLGGMKKDGILGSSLSGNFKIADRKAWNLYIDRRKASNSIMDELYKSFGIDISMRDEGEFGAIIRRSMHQLRHETTKITGRYGDLNPSEFIAMAIQYEYLHPGKNKVAKKVTELVFNRYKEAFK
jgi:hypothetical protein